MKKLLLLMMVGLLAAPALATITIPWETNEYGTYQIWTFNACNSIIEEEEEKIMFLAYEPTIYDNDIGEPVADFVLTSGSEYDPGYYVAGDSPDYITVNAIYGHTIDIELEIPNFAVEDLYKIIQVEVVYFNDPDDEKFVSADLDAYGTITDLGAVIAPIDIDDDGIGWYDMTYTWLVYPQPGFETISLLFENSGVWIYSVEAASVCVPIPAPGAILLGCIGVSFVGYLRRKRTL